ncbi:MAG: hypothetical protein PHF21_02295 [Bacilli bacterium]|nr:hypothetical protein [Bacilli bacterium]
MNDDTNIELPKRIDEVPKNLDENQKINEDIINQPIQNENNIFDNKTVENIAGNSNNLAQSEPDDFLGENETDKNNMPPIDNLEMNNNIETFPSEVSTLEENIIPEQDSINLQEEILTMNTPEEPVVQNNVETVAMDEQVVLEGTKQEENKPLKKKVIVEKPVKKEKNTANPVVGFFALLIILGIILAAFYYFIKSDYIKIPDELRNKIPFLTTPITTENKPNENVGDENNNPEINTVSVVGDYLELEPSVCPDINIKLLLENNLNFTYTKLSFDAVENVCDINNVKGKYEANNGNLRLIPDDETEEEILATYKETEVTLEISLKVDNDKTAILYDINQR